MIFLYIALGLIALIALLLLIFWAIGRSLPKEHQISATLTLSKATPEQVYDLCQDLPGWTTWAGVDKMTPLGQTDGHDHWRMQMGRNAMRCWWTRQERPGALEITVSDEKHKFFDGRWVYTISPHAGGTRIQLVEHGTIHPAIPRFMARYLADPAMFLKRHLRFVAKHFGDDPKTAVA